MTRQQRQRQCVMAVDRFIRNHGYAPSMRQLGVLMGCGMAVAQKAKQDAVAAGLLEHEPGQPRTLKVKRVQRIPA